MQMLRAGFVVEWECAYLASTPVQLPQLKPNKDQQLKEKNHQTLNIAVNSPQVRLFISALI